MEKTKIISIAFLVVSIVLAIYLGRSIYVSITETQRLASVEAKVIASLTMIREAQIAYQAVNGKYTSDWGKLKNFIESGQFYLTTRTEKIIMLEYGTDSVSVKIDTLGTVFVKDSIFNESKYPNFDLTTLDQVPGSKDAKFAMWADKIDKGGVMVDVIEVWDPKPIDPRRKETNEARNKKPLRFGSRTSVTTTGNWE